MNESYKYHHKESIEEANIVQDESCALVGLHEHDCAPRERENGHKCENDLQKANATTLVVLKMSV